MQLILLKISIVNFVNNNIFMSRFFFIITFIQNISFLYQVKRISFNINSHRSMLKHLKRFIRYNDG